MKLEAGTKIGRYEIQSSLGAGGMGEIYRALDSRLGRGVALKFLKPTDDAELLRRFRQEAKAIAALNHPNILIVHEVGEFENHDYIVSELVEGKNLREIIDEEKLSLEEILDIGIQTGNALVAAHKLGIVHRDIKPENIMILPDGYVKVLDFGLAKFTGTDKNFAASPDAATASLIQTKAGLILGTVNYMSPEQLRGKAVDERADIWSLGIILFEMLAGRRPFVGETVSDVIAAVIERPLPSFADLSVNVPEEIEKIVSECLKKKADERFGTARELVAALKAAKNNSTGRGNYSVEGQIASNSFHSQKTVFTNAGKVAATKEENFSGVFVAGKKFGWRVVGILGTLLLLIFGGGMWLYLRQSPSKPIKIRSLTTAGNVTNAALSPDGQFFAFVQNNDGQQSLWLRRVDNAAATNLLPESADIYAGLVFSPDGGQIYYTVFDRHGRGTLKRVKMFDSVPQEVIKNIDSTAAFAPDGKTFAFIRASQNVDQIVVANTETDGERVVTEKKRPEFYSISSRESLSWSPDGKFIACPFGKILGGDEFMSVVKINAETGAETPLTEKKWYRVGRVAWTKSGELLVTATDPSAEFFQIWKILPDQGEARNITNSLSDYFNLSVNASATLLLGVDYDRSSRIFTASADKPDQIHSILGGGRYDGVSGICWTKDGRVVYVSTESGNRDIWIMNANGSKRRQLTFDEAIDDTPAVSSDDKFIVFVSARGGVPHIWRMNLDGGELKQLTDKGGESFPVIAPDNSYIVYSLRLSGMSSLWKISIEGGEPSQFTKQQTSRAAISPDGKFIACVTRGDDFESQTELAIFSAETGEFQKSFKPAGELGAPGLPIVVRWMPDGKSIAYVANNDGVSNVWTQNITNDEPKKLTNFTADKIFAFDWSKDGKNVVYARGSLRNNLVLIEDF